MLILRIFASYIFGLAITILVLYILGIQDIEETRSIFTDEELKQRDDEHNKRLSEMYLTEHHNKLAKHKREITLKQNLLLQQFE